MNHSRTNANVVPCVLRDKRDRFMTIGFKAKRDIEKGEELLFDYRQPDESWDDL